MLENTKNQEYNFFKSLGTANFWANDFSQGLSFVIGAVLSEGAMSGLAGSKNMGRAKDLLKRGLYSNKKVGEGMTKARKGLNNFATGSQIKNSLTTVRQLGTGAAYESGVEARHHYDETVANLIADFQERNKGRVPSDHEKAQIVDLATKSANAVFAGNMALVGYGNYMMFPRIFGKGLNSSNTVRNQIKSTITDKGRAYAKLAKDLSKGQVARNTIWRVAKTPKRNRYWVFTWCYGVTRLCLY